ncbi:MAG: MASE1 domain-containing protein, partial [Gammaproteobacteria bacterium]|nr:MASE1 domain-containing protein [Gammaproteobacteria bacterium]
MNKKIILYILWCTTFGLLYYFSGELGLLIDTGFPGVTPLWPPSGIMLLVFLLMGVRYWPAVFIGIGLLAHHNEIPFNVALIAASGNTLEALLAWYLLKKVNFKLSFSK